MFNVFSSLKFFWKRRLYILDIFYVSNSDTYNMFYSWCGEMGKKKGGLQGRQIKRGWKLLYNKSPSIISNGKLLVLSIE